MKEKKKIKNSVNKSEKCQMNNSHIGVNYLIIFYLDVVLTHCIDIVENFYKRKGVNDWFLARINSAMPNS